MKNLKKIAVVLLAVLMVASVFTACDLKLTQEQKILGEWRDSSGKSGFEFLENNACKVTLLDFEVSILGNSLDGTFDGTYTVSKNDNGDLCLTVTFTALFKSITKNYTYTLKDNALTLTDVESGNSVVYFAYTAPTDAAAQ